MLQKKYQIFISSTYIDLIEARQRVQDAILSMYHFPIGMEMFSAADDEQWKVIQETIDSSDYYILIIGHRYGSVIEDGPDAGISFTQKEFRYAKSKGIPILAFIADKSVPIDPAFLEGDTAREKLKSFKKEVKDRRHIQVWKNPDDLKAKVLSALHMQFERDTTNKKIRPGWVRNGNQIQNAGNRLLYSLTTSPEQDFSKVIKGAKRVTIYVKTGVNILNQFETAIRESLQKGCEYRILAYDYKEADHSLYSAHSKNNHYAAHAPFIHLSEEYPSLEYRETSRWPSYSILYVEYPMEMRNYIQIQLYPQTMKGSQRPMFKVSKGDEWYTRFLKEIETLWEGAEPGKLSREDDKQNGIQREEDGLSQENDVSKAVLAAISSMLETAQENELSKRTLSAITKMLENAQAKEIPNETQSRIEYRNITVGDLIPFGTYPLREDGKVEPLIWRVLAIEDGMALLITEKLIDAVAYNEESDSVTWETCTLRKWLNKKDFVDKKGNGSFFLTAFTDKERARIALTTNKYSGNPEHGTRGCKPTVDKIFALSIYEVNYYYRNDIDRMAATTPYAVKNGAVTHSEYSLPNGEKTGWWWLRSPGIYSNYAAFVNPFGVVNEDGNYVDCSGVSVRPALWLNL